VPSIARRGRGPGSVAGTAPQGPGAVTAQLAAPLLLGALSVALLAQGAYYLRAQLYVAALVRQL